MNEPTQDEKQTMITSTFEAVADVLSDVWQSDQGAPESPDPARAELIVNAIMDDVIAASAKTAQENPRPIEWAREERSILAKMSEKKIKNFSYAEMYRVFAPPVTTLICFRRVDNMIKAGRLSLSDVYRSKD